MIRSRRVFYVMVPIALASVALAGCTSSADVQTKPQVSVEEPSPQPGNPAMYVDGGGAESNLPIFQETLLQFAAADEPVQGEPIVNVLTAVGFDKSTMQVSFDHSKTGLDADSIFVSARFDENCLVGQIASADRGVSIEQMPAVGPNQDICLIGNTRPIDW